MEDEMELSPVELIEADKAYALNSKVKKQLLWFGIASLVMMFAGLTSAYVVSRSDVLWVSITPPQPFFTSTYVIILSSILMIIAVKLARVGNKLYNIFQVAALACGILFCVNQYNGWIKMSELGMHFTFSKVSHVNGVYGEDYILFYKGIELLKDGEEYYSIYDKEKMNPLSDDLDMGASDSASSYFILLVGLHILHVFAGLICMFYSTVKGLRGKYMRYRVLGLELSAYFWHFVGILWLYLFGFLLYIH